MLKTGFIRIIINFFVILIINYKYVNYQLLTFIQFIKQFSVLF